MKYHLLCDYSGRNQFNSIITGPYFVALSPDAHQEVVGLDVAMNEVLVVHVLDPS